jgi:predicted ATPase/DNA-binding XRE family transcriptional regulator
MPTRPVDPSASLLESFVTFGDMLKYLRRRARLTQSELAIAVGYSREQITKLENNQRLPDMTVVKALLVPALDLDERPDLVERLLQFAEATRAAKAEQPDEANALLAPPRALRTNLHPPFTSFVGREREIAEVRRLLGSTRLLTLIGPGGMGKTRLALQAGSTLQDDFADGVWLVELSALADPTLVPHTVALALGIASASARPLDTVLADYLCDKQLLLILDNCEHLLDACATLAEFLLREAPYLRILVTSREALGVLSATTWQVPALSLPDPSPAPDTPAALEHLRESEAVQLFIERAATVQPDFTLTPHNAPAVARVCQRLDGMPLAIELAAMRVRVMSVQELAARLDDRFRVLTSGNRTAQPRHRTLRALIDWSFDLLAEDEQALLRRLSVFAGGWTLEAAERMGEREMVLDLLTHLVNKSLVVVDEHDDTTRYRLLETIGAYAREKLVQASEEHDAWTQHLDYYLWLVEQAAPHLSGLYRNAWYARLEAEHANLRAALEWATRHDRQMALRLIANLWYFWLWNGYWSEGLTWADRVLPATAEERTGERMWALIGGATLAGRTGDDTKLAAWLAEGLGLAQALDEKEGIAWARITMGVVAEEYLQATAFLDESIALARAAKNDWLAAMALFVFGERARSQGERERATAHYSESLALFRTVDDQLMIAWPLGNLGRLALQGGDYAQAQVAFEESVTLCRAAGNKLGAADWLIQVATAALYQLGYARARAVLGECLPLSRDLGHDGAVADGLVIAASVADAKGHWERAATLLAAADMILERFRVLYRVVDPSSYAEYTRRVEAVRVRLGELSFASAWARGRAMTRAQAIAYALAEDTT